MTKYNQFFKQQKIVKKEGIVKSLRSRCPLDVLLWLLDLERSIYFSHLPEKADKNVSSSHSKEKGIVQSMSRTGNCLDHGAMESFLGQLKSECYFGKRFETVEQLEQMFQGYIDYYNNERIQVKLKGLSPVEYRTQSLN